jgi:hypothetical protein
MISIMVLSTYVREMAVSTMIGPAWRENDLCCHCVIARFLRERALKGAEALPPFFSYNP